MTSAPITDQPDETLDTTDEVCLRIRRWSAHHARAVVVLVHGFGASSTDGAVVRQAEAFVAHGFDVVSYDSRGHGHSGGRCTLGDLERHDVAAVVTEAGRASLPVIVVGASMGAIAVLRYAAHHPGQVVGVIAISSPAQWRAPRSVQGVLAAGLTQTRLGRGLALRMMNVRLAGGWTDPLPPTELVAEIGVPVAIVHGDRDRFIPPAAGCELYRHCGPKRRWDLVPGMGHAFDALAVAPVMAAADWVLATGD